ncbi:MAG: transposase [Planctomycetota bacterium]|nr:transposase [Planctomycetota bacterium]
MIDYDNPWKEALELFLKAFLRFFFPDIHADLDWSRGYESLDKELQQIVREGELGPRLADKLFKVWLADGEELWILIHVEVQNRRDEQFGERMYIYNYRIYDRFRHPVISLAVLGDEQRRWRPRQFTYRRWGFSLRMQFPIVKLLDYVQDLPGLEANSNPFAAVVLAHLKTLETRRCLAERYQWKTRLVKSLFERGLKAEEIRQLFRLIDWLMDLPPELERQFAEEIHRFEEERQMPYITSVERLAQEKGLEQGTGARA